MAFMSVFCSWPFFNKGITGNIFFSSALASRISAAHQRELKLLVVHTKTTALLRKIPSAIAVFQSVPLQGSE
jgi:hypothetical protein